MRDRKEVNFLGEFILGFVQTGRTGTREREKIDWMQP